MVRILYDSQPQGGNNYLYIATEPMNGVWGGKFIFSLCNLDQVGLYITAEEDKDTAYFRPDDKFCFRRVPNLKMRGKTVSKYSQEKITAIVVTVISKMLDCDSTQIPLDKSLPEMGIGSVQTLVERQIAPKLEADKIQYFLKFAGELNDQDTTGNQMIAILMGKNPNQNAVTAQEE